MNVKQIEFNFVISGGNESENRVRNYCLLFLIQSVPFLLQGLDCVKNY